MPKQAAKRELIKTGTDKQYVRRNASGQFNFTQTRLISARQVWYK